jgi:hypothetical protein
MAYLMASRMQDAARQTLAHLTLEQRQAQAVALMQGSRRKPPRTGPPRIGPAAAKEAPFPAIEHPVLWEDTIPRSDPVQP